MCYSVVKWVFSTYPQTLASPYFCGYTIHVAAPKPAPSLTPDQQREAHKLYAHLLALQAANVRQVTVTLDGDTIGVRPSGRRIDVAILTRRVIIESTA